jgi:hypothetical protein
LEKSKETFNCAPAWKLRREMIAVIKILAIAGGFTQK